MVRRSGQSPVRDVTGHLEINEIPFHRSRVSKVEQMETELRKLSPAELRQIREWLDEMIEDEKVKLTQENISLITYQIVCGIHHLNKASIIHRVILINDF